MQGQCMGSEGKLLMKKELIVEICEGLMVHADLEFDYRAQLLIARFWNLIKIIKIVSIKVATHCYQVVLFFILVEHSSSRFFTDNAKYGKVQLFRVAHHI